MGGAYDDVPRPPQRNVAATRSLRVTRNDDPYWGRNGINSVNSVADTVFDENLSSARAKRPSQSNRIDYEQQRRENQAAEEYKRRLDMSNSSYNDSANASGSSLSKITSGLSRFLGLKKSSRKNAEAEDFASIYNDQPNAFVRGGVRATVAGTGSGTLARRHVAPTIPATLTSHPPRLWDTEQVVRWLNDLGLQQYTAESRHNGITGDQLLQMSGSDFEKDLGVKNSLHIKKLQIAVQRLRAIAAGHSTQSDIDHPSNRLHSDLVLRWLDDIGLPQLKDAFVECQVDGAVLNLLSIEDLAQLKVTSRLHALSIRWGITALRQANFDMNKFIRRVDANGNDEDPAKVMFWTSFRVMDWLRSIDLAEYAANVRGSGVHGSLLLLESSFTSNTLAAILQIPSNRTLLRRHLSKMFDLLVGQAAAEAKQATAPSDTLMPNTKLKLKKSGKGTSIFGSSSKGNAQPTLSVDVTRASNSSLNASLLSSPSVDGKILQALVGSSHLNGNGETRNNGSPAKDTTTDSNSAASDEPTETSVEERGVEVENF